MKIKCARQSDEQKELIQNTHMGLNLYIAKGMNVDRFVAGQYSIFTDILKQCTVRELKRLLTTLHELTSETAEELSKRTG